MDTNGQAPARQRRRRGVYLIRSGAFVKIGRTECFTARFAAFLLHNPHVELEAFIATHLTLELERYLHEVFAEHHHRGEWFTLDTADVAAARRAATRVTAKHLKTNYGRQPLEAAPVKGPRVMRGDPQHLGGDTWRIRVFLGLDRDTGKQLRKSRSFKADGIRRARAEARRVEDEIRAEYEQSKQAPPDTLRTAVERWWGLWRQRDRSPHTRQSYRQLIDNHILQSPMAEKPLTDVTVGDFDRWYVDLTKRVSPSTVQRINAVAVQVFDQCMRDGVLDRNPAALAHRPEVRSPRRQRTTQKQVEEILRAAMTGGEYRARALWFAAMTGLRRGELIALRWSRVDVDAEIALIESNTVAVQGRFLDDAVDGDRRMVMVEKDPKGHQVAAIALGEVAAAVVRAQMDWQIAMAQRAGVGIVEDPYLWQMAPPFDKPLWPDTVSHWMHDARLAAGHPQVRLHDLRHYQASVMLEVGATVEDVRERLRHRSIHTTSRYLEADTSKQKVLVAMLPELQLPAARSTD
jgi:integrase